jgi:hypothetical protein
MMNTAIERSPFPAYFRLCNSIRCAGATQRSFLRHNVAEATVGRMPAESSGTMRSARDMTERLGRPWAPDGRCE